MKRGSISHEFHARLTTGGAILLPPEAVSGLRPGDLLRVRVETGGHAGIRAGVVPDEGEVMQIAMRQAESPDIIRKSLRAQGVLSGSARFAAATRRAGRINT